MRKSLVWIAFVTPIFSSTMVYLYAGILKPSDARVMSSKTNQALRAAMYTNNIGMRPERK